MDDASCPTQAFQALGSQEKAGMRDNKILREEMALQDVGEYVCFVVWF